MLLMPRGALRACALLAVLVAAVAVPASSKIQTFPGGCRAIDTMDAKASGDALALSVKLDGQELLGTDFANVSATQVGPGMNDSAEPFMPTSWPRASTSRSRRTRSSPRRGARPRSCTSTSSTAR